MSFIAHKSPKFYFTIIITALFSYTHIKIDKFSPKLVTSGEITSNLATKIE